MTWAALEVKADSSIALTEALEYTTVSTVKMLELSVLLELKVC